MNEPEGDLIGEVSSERNTIDCWVDRFCSEYAAIELSPDPKSAARAGIVWTLDTRATDQHQVLYPVHHSLEESTQDFTSEAEWIHENKL